MAIFCPCIFEHFLTFFSRLKKGGSFDNFDPTQAGSGWIHLYWKWRRRMLLLKFGLSCQPLLVMCWTVNSRQIELKWINIWKLGPEEETEFCNCSIKEYKTIWDKQSMEWLVVLTIEHLRDKRVVLKDILCSLSFEAKPHRTPSDPKWNSTRKSSSRLHIFSLW